MKRAVCRVIRLVAAGFLLFGGITIGFQFLRHRLQKADISVGYCILGTALGVVGIILLLGSSSLAEQLTDEDDTEE